MDGLSKGVIGISATLMVIGVVAVSSGDIAQPGHDPIPVRHPEGTVHGFLSLSTEAGSLLAHGDLLQTGHNGTIKLRMVFRFADSSYFEETTTFTQDRVFSLRSYHLVQRGPAFARDLDAALQAGGQYLVTTREHDGGDTKRYTGSVDWPSDVSNGLVITVLKNLAPQDTQTVHIVAFTPEPRLVRLELTPTRQLTVLHGVRETAIEYTLKPQLGALVGLFARLLGKVGPDSRVWIVTEDVPAFVRFTGPLYTGPVWRIELSTPQSGP